MNDDVVPWTHPREAAAEAVVWALLEDVAKERKEAARAWVADCLRKDSSKGFDAVANGEIIGSVTRSKDTEKLDVADFQAFLAYAMQHQPHLISVEYQAKNSFLKTLKKVGDTWIDPDGTVVPGVGLRTSFGSVRVNKDKAARAKVEELLAAGHVSIDGIKALEAK